MVNPIYFLLSSIISVIELFLIIWVILSLLISFDIVNPRQAIISRVFYALERLINPLLNPLRKVLPNLGGIDISPILMFILLRFVDMVLFQVLH